MLQKINILNEEGNATATIHPKHIKLKAKQLVDITVKGILVRNVVIIVSLAYTIILVIYLNTYILLSSYYCNKKIPRKILLNLILVAVIIYLL